MIVHNYSSGLILLGIAGVTFTKLVIATVLPCLLPIITKIVIVTIATTALLLPRW